MSREIPRGVRYASLEEEALLSLVRTSNELWQGFAGVLRPSELSATQYHALRVLRDAGPEGLPCGEIGGRMVTSEPDMTRLLDRLEDRGLARRSRSPKDRRVVTARITDDGLALLSRLDGPVESALARQLGHLGDRRLRRLVDLLEAARGQGG